jgi:hypothetical protein
VIYWEESDRLIKVLLKQDCISEADRREAVKKERRAEQNRAARSRYDAKTKRVKTTLSPKEFAYLERQAKIAGQSPSAYLKELAFLQLRGQEQYIPSAEVVAHLSKLIALIRNVANNINQLSYHFNRHDLDIKPEVLNPLLQYFIEVLLPLLPKLEDEVKAFVVNPPKAKNYDSEITQ